MWHAYRQAIDDNTAKKKQRYFEDFVPCGSPEVLSILDTDREKTGKITLQGLFYNKIRLVNSH